MKATISAVIGFVLEIAVCRAQAVYTYSGNNFTSVQGIVTTSDRVTGSFGFLSALPPSQTSDFLPNIWTISDGISTFSSSGANPSIIVELTTDASGNIVSWNITLFGAGATISTCYVAYQCNEDSTDRLDINANFLGLGAERSNPGTWSESIAPPSAPTTLSALPGNAQVTLTWTSASGATSYHVKRSLVSGGPYTTIATVDATTYIDYSVSNGTTYFYVVSALASSGESANSLQVSSEPVAPLPPPLTIFSVPIPQVTVGTAYSQVLTAIGGVPPYSWSLASGTLPPGLSLVPETSGDECTITGNPTVAGTFSFFIALTDKTGTGVTYAFAIVVGQAVPSVCSGCVLNAASFAKDSSGHGVAVAPGSLVAIFTSVLATSPATFSTPSLPGSLSDVSVTFNGIPAPMISVTPTGQYPYVSAQVPFEVLSGGVTSGNVPIVLTVNGVRSVPVQTPIVQSAPGIFTIPATGQGNGILVYVDPADNTVKIAAPVSASSAIGYPTAPIARGASGFFYATGIGAMTPSVPDGSGSCPAPTGLCYDNAMPTVLVGGITASVAFAGQAPGYPGANQINIVIPNGAPTGNAVPLQILTADGTIISTPGATIAVQ